MFFLFLSLFHSEHGSGCKEGDSSSSKGVGSCSAHANLASGPVHVTGSADSSANCRFRQTSSFGSASGFSFHAVRVFVFKVQDFHGPFLVFPDRLAFSGKSDIDH